MKIVKTLLKLAAAVAAIAGIAYLVVKYIDTITDWLQDLCPCKAVPAEELPVEETPAQEAAVEEAPAEEAATEEAPAEDAPAEEAPEQEADPIPEGEPVAEESDFEA